MGRKKGSLNKINKNLQSDHKDEVIMSETQVLETIETEIDLKRQELERVKVELAEVHEKLQRREIDQEERRIIDKQVEGHAKGNGLKEKIEKQKAYDDVMVTGKFINRRHPGSAVKLTYMKYESDPVKWYDFEDGKVYTIKRGFCDQIKDHYYKPSFIQKSPDEFMDPSKPGSAISAIDTSNKLYDFVPINF